MDIYLVRHGKPDCADERRVSATEFVNWVERYDKSTVCSAPIMPETQESVRGVKRVFASDMKRAVETTKMLSLSLPALPDPVFREASLPRPPHLLRGVKLSTKTWTIALRLAWLFGYKDGVESWRDVRLRADRAAALLIAHAKEADSVLLVAHGFFNFLIGIRLRRVGWQGPHKTRNGFGSCTHYYRPSKSPVPS